jgi:hypothetical protein
MLARRKRRQEEDEKELLVPHGLIWQAIEKPMSPQPETANSAASKDAAKATASAAPSSPARSGPESGTTKPKLGAISPPLRWPSLQIQEIARPMQRRFPGIPPELNSPPLISPPAQDAPPEAVATPPAAVATVRDVTESASAAKFLARLRTERDRVTQVFQGYRQRASEAWESTKEAA